MGVSGRQISAFKASLGYRVSSRIARAVRESLSQKTKKEKKKERKKKKEGTQLIYCFELISYFIYYFECICIVFLVADTLFLAPPTSSDEDDHISTRRKKRKKWRRRYY